MRSRSLLLGIVVILAAGAGLAGFGRVSYAPTPSREALANPTATRSRRPTTPRARIGREQAATLRTTEAGRRTLSPEAGAFTIDEAVIARGREAFYTETFGNEVFPITSVRKTSFPKVSV